MYSLKILYGHIEVKATQKTNILMRPHISLMSSQGDCTPVIITSLIRLIQTKIEMIESETGS